MLLLGKMRTDVLAWQCGNFEATTCMCLSNLGEIQMNLDGNC